MKENPSIALYISEEEFIEEEIQTYTLFSLDKDFLVSSVGFQPEDDNCLKIELYNTTDC